MVGPPQRTRFAESSTERSRQFVALRKRSQGTVEAKRARRKQEKVQKNKVHCGESSQARYKLCSLHVRFNRSRPGAPWPTCMRNAYIRTGTARHEASCACVVLVYALYETSTRLRSSSQVTLTTH